MPAQCVASCNMQWLPCLVQRDFFAKMTEPAVVLCSVLLHTILITPQSTEWLRHSHTSKHARAAAHACACAYASRCCLQLQDYTKAINRLLCGKVQPVQQCTCTVVCVSTFMPALSHTLNVCSTQVLMVRHAEPYHRTNKTCSDMQPAAVTCSDTDSDTGSDTGSDRDMQWHAVTCSHALSSSLA